MKKLRTPRELLLDAAKLIETRGWTQQAYARRMFSDRPCEDAAFFAGSFCAIGALKRVSKGNRESWCIAKLAADNAADGNMIAFNDAPGRTKAEVVAKLREAAGRCAR
jgi:hypothetical protein